MQIKLPTSSTQRVPNFDRIFPINPDFVADISRITGARDVHWHASDFAAGHAEIFQIRNFRLGYSLQQPR